MHTTATDGRDDLESMAAAAHRKGHRYIAITDHSKALAMANGLDERRALEHAGRVRALNGRFDGLTLLAGIERDILPDGRLDLANECLAQLDFVVASVHSQFSQDEAQMTDRLLKALECPWVDALGHPTGRLLLKRDPLRIDIEQVTAAAARHGVALEINCQVDRLDLNDAHARLARDRGVRLVISTDAHSVTALGNLRWGVQMARRAWLGPDDVLNTRDLDTLRPLLRRNRTSDVDKPVLGFIALKSLKQGPPDPDAGLAEIRRLYFTTTRNTIDNDLAHAIELLKSLPTEEARERATVFMQGLSEMQREWQAAGRKTKRSKSSKKR